MGNPVVRAERQNHHDWRNATSRGWSHPNRTNAAKLISRTKSERSPAAARSSEIDPQFKQMEREEGDDLLLGIHGEIDRSIRGARARSGSKLAGNSLVELDASSISRL
jgi:hypothetical protein